MPDFMTPEQLKKEWDFNFTNHTPTTEGIVRIESLRESAKAFAHVLIANCPPSRDLSLALTSLEETLFHGNAAIARNLTEDKKPERA